MCQLGLLAQGVHFSADVNPQVNPANSSPSLAFCHVHSFVRWTLIGEEESRETAAERRASLAPAPVQATAGKAIGDAPHAFVQGEVDVVAWLEGVGRSSRLRPPAVVPGQPGEAAGTQPALTCSPLPGRSQPGAGRRLLEQGAMATADRSIMASPYFRYFATCSLFPRRVASACSRSSSHSSVYPSPPA